MRPISPPPRRVTRQGHSSLPPRTFSRQFALLPFDLPRLTDKSAAQLIDVLEHLLEGITFHYAHQIERYRHRQELLRQQPRYAAPTQDLIDPPF